MIFREANEGFIAVLERAKANLQTGDLGEVGYILDDLIDELAGTRVKVLVQEPEPAGPVPAYDPAEDGDYGAWLAANNID